MRRYYSSQLICLLLLALSAPARVWADAPATPSSPPELVLTGKGRFLVAGALSGNWSDDGRGQYGSLSRWNVDGAAHVTYFVRDHIGVGANLGGGASAGQGAFVSRSGTSERANQLSVGVHASFNWQLATRLSLMFTPAVLYLRQWLDSEGADLQSPIGRDPPRPPGATFQQQAQLNPALHRFELGYVRTALNIPLVFHASKSVALGFGPTLWLDFIVQRQPDYGAEIYQSPDYYPDDFTKRARRTPLPLHRRFQVGLFTTIIIAI